MSLPEVSLAQAVKQQYITTMRTLGVSFYRNLIMLELIFGLCSYWLDTTPSDVSWMNASYYIRWDVISDGNAYWIALFYVMAMAWLLAGGRLRNIAFTFVANRLSLTLSNLATLFTLSGIASLIGTLNMILMRIIFAYAGQGVIFWDGFCYTPYELFVCFAACFGYSLLFGAMVYLFIIIVIRQSKILLIVPLLLFLIIEVPNFIEIFLPFAWFFGGEEHIFIFLLKTILTALLLFGMAYPVSRRLEVRH